MLHKLATHIATLKLLFRRSFFSHYMHVLALLSYFMHVPMQTTLIYLNVAVCAFCLYIATIFCIKQLLLLYSIQETE